MRKQYLKKCKQCGNLLVIDDIDYQFDGCQDEVLICNKCSLVYFVKVRYNKIYKVTKEKVDLTGW